MEKYKNKYRIPSARLQDYDYGQNGAYFITICTQNRECFFGEVVNDEMQLNKSGQMAHDYWMEIPTHFSFVQLGEFVVMPNHIHGILIINKIADSDGGSGERGEREQHGEREQRRDAINRVSTLSLSLSLPVSSPPISPSPPPSNPPSAVKNLPSKIPGGVTGNKNPMFHDNISRVVRWYKGRCSFEIRKIHDGFGWQSRFHDHIIRNEQEYQRIGEYIRNNPAKWNEDKFFK